MEMNKPLISIIAAMSTNRVIGFNNRLPWHLPADLKHFKALTIGKPILMGRKTWESLPGLLPDRPHIVISTNPEYHADGCTVVGSVDQALVEAGDVPEIMVVGGSAVYQLMLPLARRMYLTLVHADIEGDAVFPPFDQSHWREAAREEYTADERNPFDYSFLTLERQVE